MIVNEFLVSTIVGIVTGLGGWFVARKKNKAETKITELDAVEKAVKVWRELSEQLQVRYDDLLKKQLEMEKELQTLRDDYHAMKIDNEQLRKKLSKLTTQK